MINRLTKITIISIVTFLTLGWSNGENPSKKQGTSKPDAAIVSIYMHMQVSTIDFPGIQESFTQLTYGDIFNYRQVLKQAHGRLMDGCLDEMSFNLLPEAQVLATSGYDNSLIANVKQSKTKKSKITPEGYIPIAVKNKTPIMEVSKLFPDAAGIVIILMDYELQKIKQIDKWGTAKVQARVQIKVIDKMSKKLYKLSHTGLSDEEFTFDITNLNVRGEIRPLRDLCREATDNLFNTISPAIQKGNAQYERIQASMKRK